MNKKIILLLNGNQISGDDPKILIESLGFDVILCDSEATALSRAKKSQVDMAILASSGPNVGGVISAVKQFKEINRSLPIILLAENGSKAHAVAAFRAGVKDYIDYPCSRDELLRTIVAC
jgi:DNA-binding response OmpR family regulator